MRKILILSFVVSLYFASSGIVTVSASSNLNMNKYVDSVISSVICEDYGVCDFKSNKIKTHKEKVYDITVSYFGYIYEFQLKNDESVTGFMIIEDSQEKYIVREIILGEDSPYSIQEYINVYGGFNRYYELKGDIILDTVNSQYYDYVALLESLGYQEFQIAAATGYIYDTLIENNIVYTTDPVTFFSYTDNDVNTDYGFPNFDMSIINDYTNHDDSNNCSTTAGLTLILYYEKYYSDTTILGSVTKYQNDPNNDEEFYSLNDYVNGNTDGQYDLYYASDIYDELYENMDTNNWLYSDVPLMDEMYDIIGLDHGLGTLHGKFLEGLQEYYEQRDYDIIIEDIIGDSTDMLADEIFSFDNTNSWDDYKSSIDDNVPVVIQLGGLDLLSPWTLLFQSGSPSQYEFINGGFITIDDSDSQIVSIYGDIFELMEVTYTYTSIFPGLHTVIGYGYRELDFYTLDNYGFINATPVLTDKFATIRTGYGTKGYINSSSVSISQAYSFNIEAIPPC